MIDAAGRGHCATYHFPSSAIAKNSAWLGWEGVGSDTLTCMPNRHSLRSWMSPLETGVRVKWWKISKGRGHLAPPSIYITEHERTRNPGCIDRVAACNLQAGF